MKPKKFWYSWHIYLLEIGTAALLVWVTAALRPSLLLAPWITPAPWCTLRLHSTFRSAME